jgi:hypothetical protein
MVTTLPFDPWLVSQNRNDSDTLKLFFLFTGTAFIRSTKPLEAKDNGRQQKTTSGNSHIQTSQENGPTF